MRRRLAACAAVLLVLSGNAYKKSFMPIPVPPGFSVAHFNGEPEIIANSGVLDDDLAEMWARGFGPIGYSGFTGTKESVKGALKQAKAIGARYVLVGARYLNSVESVMPLTTPSVTTSDVSGTFHGLGGGSGTFNGTATSHGTTTTYVPYRYDNYDQTAYYFIEVNRFGFGVLFVNSDKLPGRNPNGVVVFSVRRGAPISAAGLMPGDALVAIGDATISSPDDVFPAWQRARGKDTAIRFFRNGQEKVVHVKFSEDGTW